MISIAALAYAERGLPIHPLHPREKTPLTLHGWCDATTDAETISAWWRRWPMANVAIAIPEGFVVVDVDGPEGEASLTGRHRPVTVTARTGSGLHCWYRLPEGLRPAKRIGALSGVDLLTAGNYVVAPPSVHPSGAVYQWADLCGPDEVKIAPAPAWVLDLLQEKRVRADRPRSGAAPERGERIPEGERNGRLTSFGGKLREVGMELPELSSTLLLHNAAYCDPPLPEGEVKAIARSVAGYPAGPVRVDRRIMNAHLSDGATLAAALLSAGIPEEGIAEAAGVGGRTAARWLAELRTAGLEALARSRPRRRFVTVPRDVLLDCNLATGAKATALVIALYMSEGRATVGRKALAAAQGIDARNIGTHLQHLERQGHLKVARTKYDPKKGKRERVSSYAWWTTISALEGAETRHKRSCGQIHPVVAAEVGHDFAREGGAEAPQAKLRTNTASGHGGQIHPVYQEPVRGGVQPSAVQSKGVPTKSVQHPEGAIAVHARAAEAREMDERRTAEVRADLLQRFRERYGEPDPEDLVRIGSLAKGLSVHATPAAGRQLVVTPGEWVVPAEGKPYRREREAE